MWYLKINRCSVCRMCLNNILCDVLAVSKSETSMYDIKNSFLLRFLLRDAMS